jgi:uncharacterized membrane protein YoaK (UPF0700 family)
MNAPTNAGQIRLLPSLLLLTFMTGLVDAASVLGLGHVFTANMTGNVVFLGFALGGAHDVSIVASLIALASFLAGAACGGRIARADDQGALRIALALELVLLLVAAGVAVYGDDRAALTRDAILVLLAAPMGLQNAAVRRLAVPDMTTTVLTLTLTGIAADSSLAGGTNPRLARRVGAVVSMLVGAVIGALLMRRGLAWTIGGAAMVHVAALAALLSSSRRTDTELARPA